MECVKKMNFEIQKLEIVHTARQQALRQGGEGQNEEADGGLVGVLR